MRSRRVTFLGDTPDTLDTFAIIRDGIVVSKAWSVRRNNRAAEIAVETLESHRHQGYGKLVVLAWADYQLEKGYETVYSHRKGNLESKALASGCGATWFADAVSYHD